MAFQPKNLASWKDGAAVTQSLDKQLGLDPSLKHHVNVPSLFGERGMCNMMTHCYDSVDRLDPGISSLIMQITYIVDC